MSNNGSNDVELENLKNRISYLELQIKSIILKMDLNNRVFLDSVSAMKVQDELQKIKNQIKKFEKENSDIIKIKNPGE
ncbi:MAG: hypothetical protein ACOCQD_00920 [archaeon]